MGPIARILPDGQRLHLQHGPIDLIIGADGARVQAFEAARARFATILDELMCELPALRTPLTVQTARPRGKVARRMHAAVMPFCGGEFVTPMASVAGAVADELLGAMCQAGDLRRAYVNNGGDIALYLAPGEMFRTAMQAHDGRTLGHITLTAADRVCGIATSGRHGRSLSRGIADSVTVLARTAAGADVAATLIANAVDLPDHPGIIRRPAHQVVDDSDLGARAVVVGCPRLAPGLCDRALEAGKGRARDLQSQELVSGCALFLQGRQMTTDKRLLQTHTREPFDA